MALTPVTIADRTGAAQPMDQLQDGGGNNMPVISLDSTRATYRACTASAAVITTASKTILNIQGSSTKTVRVKKICFSLSAATAAQGVLQLQRTSTQGTGGTAVAPTVAKCDLGPAGSLTPAATAVVQHFTTGAQSQGTAVGGLLSAQQVNESVTTTAPTFLGAQNLQYLFPEGGWAAGQSLVLRGTADFLEVQTATAIGTTPAFSYVVEWEEDAS